MAKKTGMGSTPLSWVRDTRAEGAVESTSAPDTRPPAKKRTLARKRPRDQKPKVKRQSKAAKDSSEVQKFRTSEGMKFETFEVKLSVLLRQDQLEFLERQVREIMGNRDRDNRKERITKNTVVRICLDALRDMEFDTANIPDEEELRRRVRAAAMGKG